MTNATLMTVTLVSLQLLGAVALLWLHSQAKDFDGETPAWAVYTLQMTGSVLQRIALFLLTFGAVSVLAFLVGLSGASAGSAASFVLLDFSQALILLSAVVRVLSAKGARS